MRLHFKGKDSGFSYWEAVLIMSVTAIVVLLAGSMMMTVRVWSERQTHLSQLFSERILADAEFRSMAKKIRPPFWVTPVEVQHDGDTWILPYKEGEIANNFIVGNSEKGIWVQDQEVPRFIATSLKIQTIEIKAEDDLSQLRVVYADGNETVTSLGGRSFP